MAQSSLTKVGAYSKIKIREYFKKENFFIFEWDKVIKFDKLSETIIVVVDTNSIVDEVYVNGVKFIKDDKK